MSRDSETASVRRKYNRNARWFDFMDRMVQDQWRSALVMQATGKVLEIGVGTGKNLPFYSPSVTEQLVAIGRLCVLHRAGPGRGAAGGGAGLQAGWQGISP